MPRTYVRKKVPPSYSLEDVKRAVDDVTNKKKTFRGASEYYGVPTAVIFHRIKGRKVPLDKMGGGVSKALTERVEHHFVNCLKTRAKMGHPCHKEELKLLVGEYVTKLKIKTPFKNNIPGDCWYQNFMKRHPSLSLKKPEQLQKARTDARRPHVVYDFYDMLLSEVTNNNLADKPKYIFNADESGFNHDPSKLRAIGEKGMALSRVTGGSGRESTSVLACVSADGKFLPPCIVFKGTAVQARWVSDKAYPGTLYGATKNGWMEEPTFHNWLVNGFIPYVDKIRKDDNEPDHKVILIYDGHSSHISVRIVEDAIKANIILVKFPSHMTDRIQPLDKCVFGPVKTFWDKTLVEHGVKQMGKGSAHLSKEKFTELLGEVWGKALTLKNIVSGFNTTGVFPVDASKFPKKLFNASELKTYQNLVNTVNDIVTEESSNECVNDISIHSSSLFTDNIQQLHLNDGSISPHCTNSEKFASRVPVSEIIDDAVCLPYSSVESHSDSASARINTDEHVTLDCSNSEKPVCRVPVNIIIDDEVCPPYFSVESHSDSVSAIINTDEHVTPECSNSKKPASRVPVSVIIDDVVCRPYSDNESRLYSDSDSALNTDEHVTPVCSNAEEFNRKVLVKSIDEHVSPHCTRTENRFDSAPTKANAAELASPHCSSKKNTNSDYRGSSVLLNNILKLITLDKSANDSVKAKLLKAISSADCVEDITDDFMSPNKDILDKLFKTQNTPKKENKIVIPRLKVATYGEVLTSDAVKDRLKKAEEEKASKTKKIKIKVEKGLKNKGQGKRTKCANLHQENQKEDKKENNGAKKIKLDNIVIETDEIMVEEVNKNQCKQVNFQQQKDTGNNKQKKVRVHVSDSDSDGEQDVVPYADSDSDYNIECETEQCDLMETMGPTENLIKGNFVLVQFKGGKRLATVFRYLCMVDSFDEEDNNEVVVTSLKSVDPSKQVFALNEKDTSCVPIKDIIGLLPEPIISLKGERIFYKFKKKIDVFEKA